MKESAEKTNRKEDLCVKDVEKDLLTVLHISISDVKAYEYYQYRRNFYC